MVSLIQEKNLDYVGLEKSVAILDQNSLVERAKKRKIAKMGENCHFLQVCMLITGFLEIPDRAQIA